MASKIPPEFANIFKSIFGKKQSKYEEYEDLSQDNTTSENKKRNGRKGKISFVLIIAIVLAAVVISKCTYQVKEQEQAVILTLGKPTSTQGSGLHFKIPFIQTVKKVNTTIKGLTIGYDDSTNQTNENEALMITGDYNFVNVDFFIEYKVADPVRYLYTSGQPVSILKNICQSSIRTVIGTTDVDSVLTTGKAEIQGKVKEFVTDKLTEHNIGIQIVNISIQDAEPPTIEVMEAFKQVETAKQEKQTAINNANKYKNEKLPAARAEADKIMQEAEAQKEQRINEAKGQVSRFNKMYDEYRKYPAITKQRMFYETMEEIIPDLEVIITDGAGETQKILPLKPFTDSAADKEKEEDGQ